MGINNSIKNYYDLSKPQIMYLLVFTAIATMIVNKGFSNSIIDLVIIAIAVGFGSAGSSALTGYIDRDIDQIMNRTKNRVVPTGKIKPVNSVIYGLIISSLSLIIAYIINPLCAIFMFIGIFDNVVIYSILLKRRHSSNIILGGISGGMPVLIGYSAITTPETSWLTAVLMSALVIIWIPAHIWSLALYFKEEYQKVNVPMLTVVTDEKLSIRYIAIASIITVIFTLALYFIGVFGIIYLILAGIIGGIMLILNIQLLVAPTRKRAWTIFKYSSPYLYIIFMVMIIDSLIRITI
tara:strand:+ start:765 stop:1646 length:882 start_codon:yes stop_codon:yes gene_type:complete